MGLFDFFRKKSSSNGSAKKEEEENQQTILCFVLSESEKPGDLSGAQEAVTRVFGPGYTAKVTDDKLIMVRHGEEGVGFIGHIPKPIPNQEAENFAEGNFLWPNGKEEVAKHRSHIIATSIFAQDQTPIQSALTVTRLALVALEVFDGLGVHWGDANVCNSRETFESFCENISEEHVPVPIWLRLQPVSAGENELGMYTLGMQQFCLMDIEVERSQMKLRELFQFVSDLAHYLIQSGPVIEDGNTVGSGADEKILVRHLPSMVDESRTVYKIMFEA